MALPAEARAGRGSGRRSAATAVTPSGGLAVSGQPPMTASGQTVAAARRGARVLGWQALRRRSVSAARASGLGSTLGCLTRPTAPRAVLRAGRLSAHLPRQRTPEACAGTWNPRRPCCV